ncbi:MAG: dienelactone hydrolase family protein [Muribaculaceae bacterium]|nr:dienelactone hydrolase family protein [Muribaculaceae bacterium]
MPAFLDDIKKELTYPMAWGNSDIKDFNEWRDSARIVLKDAMLAPPPAPEDHNPELITEEKRDGYTARKVRLNVSKYTRADVLMLIPDGPGPHPGIVLLHDHGGHFFIGKEKMIKPFDVDSAVVKDADMWVDQCYGGQYVGDYLASKGYAVISADAIFWGDRGRKEGVDKTKLSEFAGNLMGLGRCLSGIMTHEDSYLTDYFASLPEVDAERVGCMGFSMGGYRAWMLSAFTDKIKSGAAVCWMTTTDSQFSWEHGRENGGYANTLPSIRLYMDHPHIASIACPKPMLFINGRTDKLFHPEGVEASFEVMHDVWKSRGADEKLSTMILDMPHYCGPEVQEEVKAFFDKWL